MGFFQSYCSLLLKYPKKILLGGVTAILTLFIISLIVKPLPTFSDPLVGFETRNTLISERLNSWHLLSDETSASFNNLSLSPSTPTYENSYLQAETPANNGDIFNRLLPPVLEVSAKLDKNTSIFSVYLTDDEDKEYIQSLNSLKHIKLSLVHHSLGSSKAFCGKLYDGYVQIVLAPAVKPSSFGLLNLNSVLAICQLDHILRLENSSDSYLFQRHCERFQDNEDEIEGPTSCCNSWTLSNYVACLNNKSSCTEITSLDIKNTEQLIALCTPYYLRSPYEECFTNPLREKNSFISNTSVESNSSSSYKPTTKLHCGSIPERCMSCGGWTYTVMNYLVDDNFIKSTYELKQKVAKNQTRTPTKHSIVGKIALTNIFLPMAKSSSLLEYYQILRNYNLKTPLAQVKAMDLGLKNSLFEHLLTNDAKLFIIALFIIFIVFSIYTWSLLLSTVVLLIICLSLCMSYTIYILILNIPVFPFMNLLAVVISLGICSDNAMLFCRNWTTYLDYSDACHQTKPQTKEQLKLVFIFKKALFSTSIATLATACSFIISTISNVVAIRCFCIFATLSVLTNYLLIILLLPPALVIDSRLSVLSNHSLERGPRSISFLSSIRKRLSNLGMIIHSKIIFDLVTKCRFYLIITFIMILSCASILVFHYPTLQPADEEELQLLSKEHIFEQYDRSLKKQFAFERVKSGKIINRRPSIFHYAQDTLPIRIVFGVKALDNGNHLDFYDRGTLTFDPKFDLADPDVQIWLLEFCRRIKQQKFIYPSKASELSNCFMETFKSWMDSRSCEDPVHSDHDRSPCCRSYEFPYSRYVLNKCVGEAINMIQKTQTYYTNMNAGLRFFKNSSKVAAVIIEYQSNRHFSQSFTRMDRFFNDVDSWVTWQINNTAPSGLRSGWFISSNLELLALQLELEQSTVSSILIEIGLAMLALFVGTHDLALTMAGTSAIGTVILVTVSILIILKWTLGVVESVLISLTIGLSIDFALHYSVAYSESKKIGGSDDREIRGILNDVGSPIALATITTSLAGLIIVWSDIKAYQELGVFLIIIAFTSWLTSTLFLLPTLTIIGSLHQLCQVHLVSRLRQFSASSESRI